MFEAWSKIRCIGNKYSLYVLLTTIVIRILMGKEQQN